MLTTFLLAGSLLGSDATDPSARLPNIDVIGISPDAGTETLDDDALRRPGAADLGELLRDINGVSASRMGGHGLDPIIRGQSAGQLNVRIDGGVVLGGCPNRMDPPTSFGAPATLDRVTVVRGLQSLRHGAGGSGGAVLIERGLPWGLQGWSGGLGLSGGTNGLDHGVDGQLLGGSERLALRADLATREHDNYSDGDGRDVRSAFRQRSAHLLVGWAPAEDHRVELGIERSDQLDTLFAGASMDSPEGRLEGVRMRYDGQVGGLGIEARLWRNAVDHLMDNYSLRAVPPAMFSSVPSTSDTTGFDISASRSLGAWDWRLGIDAVDNRRDAIRLGGMRADPVAMTANAFLWPDVRMRQVGVYVEGDRRLGESLLRAGLRADRHDAEARSGALRPAPGLPAPVAGYASYYDAAPLSRQDDAVSGLLRIEHAPTPGWLAFAGLSLSHRAPDATERYMARPHMSPAQRWFGDPDLALETHRQVDAGLAWTGQRGRFDAVLFADSVDDFVLRDRARGQPGLRLADGATVYRGVDAELRGVELAAEWQPRDGLTLDAQAAWVRGDDLSDDRPLAQIPPLNGHLRLRLHRASGEWAATLRAAARQRRVDDDSATGGGVDAGPTPGYAALDLGWRRAVGRHAWRARLRNVFDRSYAEHVNRANVDPFNPEPVQVNEPGRTLELAWEMQF